MRPTLDDLRTIEWAPTYMWDVMFPDSNLPAPFDRWFPASSYGLVNMTMTSMSIRTANAEFHIPQKSGPKTFQLTFHDNDDYVLSNWLENWYNNTIFNKGLSVATLSDAIKTLLYVPLKRTTNTQGDKNTSGSQASTLSVFPAGSVTIIGNSAPGVIDIQVDFHIVKIIPDGTGKTA